MPDLLEIGTPAPDFELEGSSPQGGVRVRLQSFRILKNVVLAFYPGDNTAG
jgi:peroxiredoxin